MADPAALPTAMFLLEHLMHQLGAGYAEDTAYLSVLRLPPVSPRRPGEFLRFEHVLDRLAMIDPYERFLRESYSHKDARPNGYHQWLATMIQRGAHVITPNFDLMIESALRQDTTGWRTTNILETERECQDFLTAPAPNEGVLQKIHGSVTGKMEARFPSLVAKGDQGPRYEAAARLMNGRTLVVVGYSGSDDYDLVPFLETMSQQDQSIIWVNHEQGVAPKIIDPKLVDPEKTRSRLARTCKNYLEISGDTATALEMLFEISDLSTSLARASEVTRRPLPDVDLSDWERILLLYGLLSESLYAQQTELLSGAAQALRRAATSSDKSRAISAIDQWFDALCGRRPEYLEVMDECDIEPKRVTSVLEQVDLCSDERLYFKVALLRAWVLRERGSGIESDEVIDDLIAECLRIQNWALLCLLPEWASGRFMKAEEMDRRALLRRAGWDIVLWTEDVFPMVGMLYDVEDAEYLLYEGVETPYSYAQIKAALERALRVNVMFGSVALERDALKSLARLEWVWNRFDSYERYKREEGQVEEVLSRPVARLQF